MTSSARGFTLIELITVLVIAAILAAFVGTRAFQTSEFYERGFYEEALAAARYAHKLAVNSGCEVQFSVASSSYTLTQRATNCTTGGFTLPVVSPGTKTDFSGTVPSGVSPFTMTSNPVVFKASGATSDGTNRTVTVGARSFVIHGGSGFVKAQ